VDGEINTKARFYVGVLVALVSVLVAFRVQLDVVVFVFFVVIAPVVVIGVLDTIDYLRLRSRTATRYL